MSRAEGSDETWALRLRRGKATASLERERRKARQVAGTTVLLSDLELDVLRVRTQRTVVDYLRARGDYSIEVVEGRSGELVTPEKPDGIKLDIAARPTLWGRIEFALSVSPPGARRRRVAVVGRAGTTIVDNIGEIEEFAVGRSRQPARWSSAAGARPDRKRSKSTCCTTTRARPVTIWPRRWSGCSSGCVATFRGDADRDLLRVAFDVGSPGPPLGLPGTGLAAPGKPPS